MKKPTKEQIEDFASDCLARLPDSIVRRKGHLICLRSVLPKGSKARGKALEILIHLEAMDKVQQEFSFTPQQDGHHN